MGSPQSLTDAVADDIRDRIYNGDLTPAAKLPTEEDLMDRHRVSRTTVRRALSQLINEGLVTSRQGVGYYVRGATPLVWIASRPERNVRTDISPADAWSVGVREQDRTPLEEITVSVTKPPERIMALLALGPDETVVVRRRVRRVDGSVMLTADSYFPERLVANSPITQPGDVLPGTYLVMAQLGHGWVRTQDRVRARMPNRDEVLRLGLTPGTPVIDHTRISWAGDGTPVRVQLATLPGDRNEIVYELLEGED